MGIWACSRTETGRERESGWVIVILVRRRVKPRWMKALVRQSEMLGRRQGTHRWMDEPVWWLWQGLGNLEGIGSIHNNEQQIIAFGQSLTEAWKNTS